MSRGFPLVFLVRAFEKFQSGTKISAIGLLSDGLYLLRYGSNQGML